MPDLHPVSSILRDAAVQSQTGKTWSEWFTVLDEWHVHNEGQTAAVRYLHDIFRISPWWAQAVVIRYIQDKG